MLSGGFQETVRALVYVPPVWYDNGLVFPFRLRPKGKAVRLRLTYRQLFEKSWTQKLLCASRADFTLLQRSVPHEQSSHHRLRRRG